MEEKVYFVMREKRVWKYEADINMFCWVTISRKKVSQNRREISEANKDFERLGFTTKSGPALQCSATTISYRINYGCGILFNAKRYHNRRMAKANYQIKLLTNKLPNYESERKEN